MLKWKYVLLTKAQLQACFFSLWLSGEGLEPLFVFVLLSAPHFGYFSSLPVSSLVTTHIVKEIS